ncbi:hypothetical protein PBRA_003325 [Plasmodiophora brassicae]|uniref:Uncharacterized protein n=1 Tax=Plasmodiophora brassicae TaxID=37360 RepID=A0A0G4J7Y3_PLABS|nr:hypothetical protein PBRA_003325 [Plasmodiophora brassicae]
MRPESDEDVLDALASDLRDALLDTEHQQGAANALDRVAACTDGQLAYFGWQLLGPMTPHVAVHDSHQATFARIVSVSDPRELSLALCEVIDHDITHCAAAVFQSFGKAFTTSRMSPTRLHKLLTHIGAAVRPKLASWETSVAVEFASSFVLPFVENDAMTETALHVLHYLPPERRDLLLAAMRSSPAFSVAKTLSYAARRNGAHEGALCCGVAHLLCSGSHDFDAVDRDTIGAAMVYSVPKVLSIAGRLGLDLIAALTPHLCDWDAPREPLREAVLSVLTFTITSSNIRTMLGSVRAGLAADVLIGLIQSDSSDVHIASLAVRSLKDQIATRPTVMPTERVLVLLQATMAKFKPDFTEPVGSSMTTSALRCLDLLSSSLNLVMFLAIRRSIDAEDARRLKAQTIAPMQQQLSRLLTRVEVEGRLSGDEERLHSARMQIRLVDSVADRTATLLDQLTS